MDKRIKWDRKWEDLFSLEVRSSWGYSNLIQSNLWPSRNPYCFFQDLTKKTLIFALCLDQHPARRPQRSKILQKENASVCLLFCGRSVLNHSRLGRGWLSEARSQCLTTLSRPLLVLAWSSYWHSAAVFLSSRTKLPCFSQRLAWPWRKDHMSQLLLLGKFKYGGGPIFKVVLEC